MKSGCQVGYYLYHHTTCFFLYKQCPGHGYRSWSCGTLCGDGKVTWKQPHHRGQRHGPQKAGGLLWDVLRQTTIRNGAGVSSLTGGVLLRNNLFWRKGNPAPTSLKKSSVESFWSLDCEWPCGTDLRADGAFMCRF